MGYEMPKEHNKIDTQTSINLFDAEFEKERDKIVKEHNLTNKNIVTQKNGEWFIGVVPAKNYEDANDVSDTPYPSGQR